jgi:anaerobic ribonucleoside-triphosphate reductase activating protein
MMTVNDILQLYQHGERLNIASFTSSTKVLGPGLRSAVWVQGCPRHCVGCIAEEWLALRPNHLITPEKLVEDLMTETVQGLTISGGDPMLQSSGLTRLVLLAKERRDIDVIVYTGYQYEQLLGMRNPSIGKFLSQIDVLIDGPYIDSLNDNQGLRGSSNQRIIYLTDRLKSFDFHHQERKMEIKIQDGSIFSIGVPEKNMKIALDRAYKKISTMGRSADNSKQKPKIRISTEKR